MENQNILCVHWYRRGQKENFVASLISLEQYEAHVEANNKGQDAVNDSGLDAIFGDRAKSSSYLPATLETPFVELNFVTRRHDRIDYRAYIQIGKENFDLCYSLNRLWQDKELYSLLRSDPVIVGLNYIN